MELNDLTWLMMGLAIGWAIGIGALLWWQTQRLRQGRRHPMEVAFKMPERDWSTKELTPRTLEPAAPIAPGLQECPQCGLAFKRVAQHIRMTHDRVRNDAA